ncbi:trp operon repressor [Orbaceae bacterium ac157xtp]
MQHDDWQKTVDFLNQAFKDNYQMDVLKLLMTPDERSAFSIRVKIIQLLLNKSVNQRQLKEQLGIGIATVTRGSNSLKETSPEFRQWLEDNLLENN